MERIEILIEEAEREVRSEAARLADAARHLGTHLLERAATAEALAKADALPTFSGESRRYSPFNSLGEVQGRGSDVDLACARLAVKVDLLNQLIWARSPNDDDDVSEEG